MRNTSSVDAPECIYTSEHLYAKLVHIKHSSVQYSNPIKPLRRPLPDEQQTRVIFMCPELERRGIFQRPGYILVE